VGVGLSVRFGVLEGAGVTLIVTEGVGEGDVKGAVCVGRGIPALTLEEAPLKEKFLNEENSLAFEVEFLLKSLKLGGLAIKLFIK